MIFAVLVVFCSRFMADQKSSRVATNLAYSSAFQIFVRVIRFIRGSFLLLHIGVYCPADSCLCRTEPRTARSGSTATEDLTTDDADNTDGSRRNAAHETRESHQ